MGPADHASRGNAVGAPAALADQRSRRPGRPPRHLDEQVQRADAPDGGDDPGPTPAGRPDRAEAACFRIRFCRHCRCSRLPVAATTGDRAPQPATFATATPAAGESGRRDEPGRNADVTPATGDCHLRGERRQGQCTPRWAGRGPTRKTPAATCHRARSSGRYCSAVSTHPPVVRRKATRTRC
jgi:hypothetical protein